VPVARERELPQVLGEFIETAEAYGARAWPLAHVGARVASGLRSGALCCIEQAGGLLYFLYLLGKLLLLFLLCLVQLHLCFLLSSLDGGIVQCLSTSRRSSLSANLARFTELLDFAAGPCRAKDFAPPFCRPEACRARPPGFCIRWANKNMFPPGAAKAEVTSHKSQEMAKHKVSDRDFVKMRMAALGHDVDVSGVDQAAFMDCDLPRPLSQGTGHAIWVGTPSTSENTSMVVGGSTGKTLERVLWLPQDTAHFYFHSPTSIPTIQLTFSMG